jgi:hypothetical protein
VWVQFVSHKLLRLAVPWALLVILVLSAVLPGVIYQGAFWLQLIGYLIGTVSAMAGPRLRSRIAGAAAAFLVLNTAAWLAFWVWISGRTAQTWPKIEYKNPPDTDQPSTPDTPHSAFRIPHSEEVVHP